MKTKSWLRLYHEFADDPKIQMLAFEDQRHYVMILCLKGSGVLDSHTPSAEYREKMIAKGLGLDPLTAREVKFRLMEPGLIDEQWQPVQWAARQFESDSSTERVQKHRAEKRKRFGNVSSKHEDEPGGQLVNRDGNVSVTAQIRAEQRENSPSGNSLDAKSADGRASPSGPPAAPSPQAQQPVGTDGKKAGKAKLPPEPPRFDEASSRSYWWNCARAYALASAGLFGICGPRPALFDEIPNTAPVYARDRLARECSEATTWAVAEHRAAFPLSSERGKEITKQVEARLDSVLNALRPATAAERAA